MMSAKFKSILIAFAIVGSRSTFGTSVGKNVQGQNGYLWNTETSFLGCFASWESLDKVIGQGFVEKRVGVSGCALLYSNTTNQNGIVLTRGGLCILTSWEKLLQEVKDLTRVQEDLCDVDCPVTIIGPATVGDQLSERGHCGGNYFFSVLCAKSASDNFLDHSPEEPACSIPEEIRFDPNYVLPENTVDEDSLEHRCVQIKVSDLAPLPVTFLVNNSPINCAGFCQHFYSFKKIIFNMKTFGVGLLQAKIQTVRMSYYNCFCLNSFDLVMWGSRTVSDDYCLQQPCVNCSETTNYISWYKVAFDKEPKHSNRRFVPTEFDIVLDTSTDTTDWEIGCPYFDTYEKFQDECYNRNEHEVRPIHRQTIGVWSPCQSSSCLLHYTKNSPVLVSLKRITIHYFMNASKGCKAPSIVLNYRNGPSNGWKRETITGASGTGSGWRNYTCPVNQKGTEPEVEINLVSSSIRCKEAHVVVLDKVTMIMTTFEEDPNHGEDQVTLDLWGDMVNGWKHNRRCDYRNKLKDLKKCGTHLPIDDFSRSGFWTNFCPRPVSRTRWSVDYCVLTYIVSEENKIPVTLALSAYFPPKEMWCPHTEFNISFGPYENLTSIAVNGSYGSWTDPDHQNTWILTFHPPLEVGDVVIVNFSSGHGRGLILLDKIVLDVLPPGPGEPTDPEPSSTTITVITTTTTTTTTTEVTTSTTTTTTPAPFNCPLHTTGSLCKENQSTSYKSMCNATDYRGVTWSMCPGEIQHQPCPNGTSGTASYECLEVGYLDPYGPDYSKCSSGWCYQIDAEVNAAEELTEAAAADYLLQIERETDIATASIGYFGHEMNYILTLGAEILIKVNKSAGLEVIENLTHIAMGIYRNVLINSPGWNDLTERTEVQAGALLIHCLEISAFELTGRAITKGVGEHYQMPFNSFPEISSTASSTHKFLGKLVYPPPSNASSPTLSVSVEIPEDWASYFPTDDLVDFVGMTMQSSYANEIFMGKILAEEHSHPVVNGHLVSFTFGNGTDFSKSRINFEENGVRITFKHESPASGSEVKTIRRRLHTETGEKPTVALDGTNPCHFLDVTQMNFSSYGCALIEQTKYKTVCECNHLSSFAILMNTNNYVGKDYYLEVLTLTLCSISIICLILSIGVYSMPSIKAIRGQRSVITLHLCICLLVGNILMVAFVDRNYFHLTLGFCTTFGIMAHYFFLAAFFWMAFEGYVLYKVLIVVFDDGKDYFAMQYVVSYGGPGVIVLATGLTAVALRHDAYESDMYCWLSGDYIWAFMGPVALILIGNTVMLVISIRKARNLSKNSVVKSHSQRHTKSFMKWIKGCAGLMCLLGTTWIVGYFMLIEDAVVSNIAAYVFTILNASQGVFLFVYHICLNKKIRQVLMSRLPKFLFSTQKTTTSTASGTPAIPVRARLRFSASNDSF